MVKRREERKHGPQQAKFVFYAYFIHKQKLLILVYMAGIL